VLLVTRNRSSPSVTSGPATTRVKVAPITDSQGHPCATVYGVPHPVYGMGHIVECEPR
jgi:hypothetical protein